MALFSKPFSEHIRDVKIGLYAIAAISVIRFLMLPVFGVPYASGTHFASATIVLLLAWLVYTVRAVRSPGASYREILGISAALALGTAVMIIIGILVDDLGGINTYYTDPAHGGELNTFAHAGGHLFGAVISTLFLWGVGSLILFIVSKTRKAVAA